MPAAAADHDVVQMHCPLARQKWPHGVRAERRRKDAAVPCRFTGRQQRLVGSAAGRGRSTEMRQKPIDHLLGDQPIGGQLAAGHVEPAGLGSCGSGAPGRCRTGRRGGWQPAAAGRPSADHVRRVQVWPRERRVDRPPGCSPRRPARHRRPPAARRSRCRWCPGSPVRPREWQTGCGVAFGHHHGVGHGQPLPVDDQMDALGQPQSYAAVRERGAQGPVALTTHRAATSRRCAGEASRESAPPPAAAQRGVFEPNVVENDRTVPGGRAAACRSPAGRRWSGRRSSGRPR